MQVVHLAFRRLLAGPMATSTPQPIGLICTGRLPMCDPQPPLPEPGQPAVQPSKPSLAAGPSLPSQPLSLTLSRWAIQGHLARVASAAQLMTSCPLSGSCHMHESRRTAVSSVFRPQQVLPGQPWASAVCVSLWVFLLFSSSSSLVPCLWKSGQSVACLDHQKRQTLWHSPLATCNAAMTSYQHGVAFVSATHDATELFEICNGLSLPS